jgi:hypothetical protein
MTRCSLIWLFAALSAISDRSLAAAQNVVADVPAADAAVA